MLLNYEKNRKGKYVAFFELQEEDSAQFHILKHTIENELANSPTLKLFEEFLSLLKPSFSEDENWSYINKIEEITLEVVNYCKKQRNYFFTDAVINNEDSEFENEFVSLKYMVKGAVKSSMDYLELTKDFKKTDLIGVCYNYLQNYKIKHNELTDWEEVSHYKLTVITGLILLKLKPDSFKAFKDFTFDVRQTKPDDIKQVLISETNKFVKSNLKRRK